MRSVRAVFLLTGVLWFSGGGCVESLPPDYVFEGPPNGNSYRCLCACEINKIPLLGSLNFYPDIDVCVPPETSTREDCTERVCPAMETLIRDEAMDIFSGMTCGELEEIEVSCSPIRVRIPTESLDCSTDCPPIDCDVSVSLTGELGGNFESCTFAEVCGEETPVICRAPGVTWEL